MKNKRRVHSPKFKPRVSLEALNGLNPVHQIAANNKIDSVQASQWKKEFQDRGVLRLLLVCIASVAIFQSQPGAMRQIGGAGHVSQTRLLTDCEGDLFAIQLTANAGIGDLDGDGVPELATQDASEQDAVSIFFWNSAGDLTTFKTFGQGGQGGFVGDIAELERFAFELASLGDFDGDGVPDILVGHEYDDDGPGRAGAFWIVLLNTDGSVKDQIKISAEVGGLTTPPKNGTMFGAGLAAIGDINSDGVPDIAVGTPSAGQFSNGGIVSVLLMNQDGTVMTQTVLGLLGTPLGNQLEFGVGFGESITGIGDLDGDGVLDIAVGAYQPLAGTAKGAVWILLLTPTGAVKSFAQITEGTPGFGAILTARGLFGKEVTYLGDLNGDGFSDLAVSAPDDDDGGDTPGEEGKGAVYILFLNATGGVSGWTVISEGNGGLGVTLGEGTGRIGRSMDVYAGLDGADELVLAVGGNAVCPQGDEEGGQILLSLDDGQRAITYNFGYTLNPPGSLSVLSGVPSIGTTLQVGIDNPLGTQNAGSIPFLVLSIQPDVNFPSGTPIPGFGMAGGAVAGELLLSLSPTDVVPPVLFGPAWAGPGQPAPIDIPIPGDPALCGLHVYTQGILSDANAGPAGVRFGMTEGLQLRIGP